MELESNHEAVKIEDLEMGARGKTPGGPNIVSPVEEKGETIKKSAGGRQVKKGPVT